MASSTGYREVMWITRTVEAPGERCWELLVDVGRWPDWGPSVSEARLDRAGTDGAPPNGGRIGAGSRGRIRALVGPWVPFHVTAFDDGRSWSWEVAGIAATSHRVDPLGPDRCRVGFEVPNWAAPYALVCTLALRRIDHLALAAG